MQDRAQKHLSAKGLQGNIKDQDWEQDIGKVGISHAALGPEMSFGPARAGLGSSCIRRDKPAGARKPVDISWWYPAHCCTLGDARDSGQAVCSEEHAVKSELQLSCTIRRKSMDVYFM